MADAWELNNKINKHIYFIEQEFLWVLGQNKQIITNYLCISTQIEWPSQEIAPNTPEPLYNTVCYNTILDITRIKVGPQKVI